MNMDRFFGNNKMICSVEAEEGAKSLTEKLENRDLVMDILPNRYERFSGVLEEKDFVSYCNFLRSSNGKKVLDMLEEENAGDYIEL